MQLVLYQNPSRINGEHQNNVLTRATDIADIISAYCYCDPVTLILKRMLRSYSASVLDVLHLYKKLRR
jgi:hypothetical protein